MEDVVARVRVSLRVGYRGIWVGRRLRPTIPHTVCQVDQCSNQNQVGQLAHEPLRGSCPSPRFCSDLTHPSPPVQPVEARRHVTPRRFQRLASCNLDHFGLLVSPQ